MTPYVVATGRFLPGEPVDSKNFGQFPAEALHIIEQKTGISKRHHVSPGQNTSDLAAAAIAACLANAGISPEEVDALILATSSPDYLLPQTAALVLAKAGLSRAWGMDVNAVCAGGLFAWHLSESLLASGSCQTVLVAAADCYSRFLYKEDLASYPYFGDGAGAVLMTRGKGGLEATTLLGNDGHRYETIIIPAGGAAAPGWTAPPQSDFFFRMRGREVFDFAVEKGSQLIFQCLEKSGRKAADVDLVITHQANINIIHAIADRTGLPRSKFFVNLDHCGNMASASVFAALDEAVEIRALQRGQLLILVSFGGGLSWGATILQY